MSRSHRSLWRRFVDWWSVPVAGSGGPILPSHVPGCPRGSSVRPIRPRPVIGAG